MASNPYAIALDVLKEMYDGETKIIRLWKNNELTELELVLYENQINDYKNRKDRMKDLVYKENPLLFPIK